VESGKTGSSDTAKKKNQGIPTYPTTFFNSQNAPPRVKKRTTRNPEKSSPIYTLPPSPNQDHIHTHPLISIS